MCNSLQSCRLFTYADQKLYIKAKHDRFTSEEFEDTRGLPRLHKSKNRQHNVQKINDKQRSTKHTQKTKDRVTRTPLKPGGERTILLNY